MAPATEHPENVVRPNHLRRGASAELPSGYGETTFGVGSAELPLGSRFGERNLFGRCFGRITCGEVVRGNYLRGVVRPNYLWKAGSAELPSGKWFGEITLWKVVRPNYLRVGAAGELLSERSLVAETTHSRACGPYANKTELVPRVNPNDAEARHAGFHRPKKRKFHLKCARKRRVSETLETREMRATDHANRERERERELERERERERDGEREREI